MWSFEYSVKWVCAGGREGRDQVVLVCAMIHSSPWYSLQEENRGGVLFNAQPHNIATLGWIEFYLMHSHAWFTNIVHYDKHCSGGCTFHQHVSITPEMR